MKWTSAVSVAGVISDSSADDDAADIERLEDDEAWTEQQTGEYVMDLKATYLEHGRSIESFRFLREGVMLAKTNALHRTASGWTSSWM